MEITFGIKIVPLDYSRKSNTQNYLHRECILYDTYLQMTALQGIFHRPRPSMIHCIFQQDGINLVCRWWRDLFGGKYNLFPTLTICHYWRSRLTVMLDFLLQFCLYYCICLPAGLILRLTDTTGIAVLICLLGKSYCCTAVVHILIIYCYVDLLVIYTCITIPFFHLSHCCYRF